MLRALAHAFDSYNSHEGHETAWAGCFVSAAFPVLAVCPAAIVGEWLAVADSAWAYGLVFLLAAIPWWEALLVVPPAIGFGLDPVPVAVLAFLGNMLPIYGIIVLHGRVTAWLERRRERADSTATRSKRANTLYTKYGLPGVALVAPVAIGVHLATVIVLVLRAPPRSAGIWMTISVGLWTILLTVSSVVGFGLLGIA